MKKFLFIFVLASLFSFSASYPVYAQERDVNVELNQLRSELLNSKLPLKDINYITQVVRNLLSQGSDKNDLRSIVLNMAKKGISGKDLNTSLEAVSVLVEAGVKTGEAGNVVLGGIDKGLAYGFKGGDVGLMAKVQEAVKQKKEQLLDEARKKVAEGGGGR
ncbi:MAG: hypothetical protein PHR73_05990 [Candidatus Omnitrophica bacterium]|nr:hypothetical protein [Candidatus Omnitrophota bacterium]